MKQGRKGRLWREKILEFAISLNTTVPEGKPGNDLLQFAGKLDPESLKAMEEAIEYGCERVVR